MVWFTNLQKIKDRGKIMVKSSQSKRLPIWYLIFGPVCLIVYLIFFMWVCYSVYVEKGYVLYLIIALSMGILFKMFAVPRILEFLKSKKL
jgi:hypothetical protein